MPLPGTRVIHPRWSEHHRPTATSAMTAACEITRAATTGQPATTAADGTWTPPSARTTVYTGPCRVVPETSDEQRLTTEERQVTRRRYAVMVTWDSGEFHIGDQVKVTEAADPQLAGKAFRVVDVTYGSEQWQRNLLAEEIEGRS